MLKNSIFQNGKKKKKKSKIVNFRTAKSWKEWIIMQILSLQIRLGTRHYLHILFVTPLSQPFPTNWHRVWAILDFDRHLDLNCTFPCLVFLVVPGSSCFGYLYRVFILTHAISWLSEKVDEMTKDFMLMTIYGHEKLPS